MDEERLEMCLRVVLLTQVQYSCQWSCDTLFNTFHILSK